MTDTFDEESTCSKCGYKASVRYLNPRGSHTVEEARHKGEMQKICLRCNHVWYEKPLDHKEQS